MFPLLVALVGVWTAFSGAPLKLADPRQLWLCGAVATACLLLMKERLFMLAAMFLFVAAQAGWHFSVAKGTATDRGPLAAAVISLVAGLALVLLVTWHKRGAKLYGDRPTRFDWGMAVVLGAGVAVGLAVILVRTVLWYMAAYRH